MNEDHGTRTRKTSPAGETTASANPPVSFGGISEGDRFGKLTVARFVDRRGRHAFWECACECGQKIEVRGDHLRDRSTASCGCAKRQYQEARIVKVEESVSMRNFGKVFVLGSAREFKGRKEVHAVCVCKYCSGTSVHRASDVLRKDFRGCGCRYIGTVRERARRHGFPVPWPVEGDSIEVMLMRAEWRSMVARCHDPNHRDYPNYGGRGIFVCERWRNDFEAFLHDYGVRPLEKTLDRIDNDGPYSPENCKWATRGEQTRNRRNTIFLQYQGRRVTLAELAKYLGISYPQAYRLHRAGNTADQIAAWTQAKRGAVIAQS
jgi:hypothetical protein